MEKFIYISHTKRRNVKKVYSNDSKFCMNFKFYFQNKSLKNASI